MADRVKVVGKPTGNVLITQARLEQRTGIKRSRSLLALVVLNVLKEMILRVLIK